MAIFTRSTPIHISCCSTACFLFHYGIMTTNWFTLYNKSFNTLSPVSSIQGRLNCKRNIDNNVWLYELLYIQIICNPNQFQAQLTHILMVLWGGRHMSVHWFNLPGVVQKCLWQFCSTPRPADLYRPKPGFRITLPVSYVCLLFWDCKQGFIAPRDKL